MNESQDLEEHSPEPTQPDKRHSQNNTTPSEEQATTDKVEKPKAPQIPEDLDLLADLREALDPVNGKWFAENIRKNYGQSNAYSPERLAKTLASEEDVSFAGRTDDLVQCLRYLFWEWENVAQGAEVAA